MNCGFKEDLMAKNDVIMHFFFQSDLIMLFFS